MASPFWIRYLINKTFAQRFFWAKVTRYPIIGKIIDHALFDGDDIFYVPTNKSIPVDEAIDDPEGMVAPSEIVDHFIRAANHHWIMDFCICRESSHCKDYPHDLGCLFLGEAVSEINPKFGRRVTVDEALAHAQKCRDAGLVHLIGKNKLDSVWLQAGPGEKLMTICNCCPCCCLWKILPTIDPEISSKVNRLPGLIVHITADCVGCGVCTKDICFVNAISLAEKNGQAIIDPNLCRGCGRCVQVCPKHAIEIVIDDPAYVRHTIERLENKVDVT